MSRYAFTDLHGFTSVIDTLERREICICSVAKDAWEIARLMNEEAERSQGGAPEPDCTRQG